MSIFELVRPGSSGIVPVGGRSITSKRLRAETAHSVAVPVPWSRGTTIQFRHTRPSFSRRLVQTWQHRRDNDRISRWLGHHLDVSVRRQHRMVRQTCLPPVSSTPVRNLAPHHLADRNPANERRVLITLFFFWYFGHIVEEMVGRIRFTRLIVAITVAPTLFVSIIGDLPTAAEMGLGLLGTVMLAIFAAENPDAPFFFGIPAWIIASIFVGIDILRFVGDRIWGSLLVMLLAIGTALVTVRQWGFADRLDMIPASPTTPGTKADPFISRKSPPPQPEPKDRKS